MVTAFDYKADLFQDSVLTAPSPALTGTTFKPTTASLFPDPASVGAYDVWYTPSIAVLPTRLNTEKIRIVSYNAGTGVYTIQRHQGITSAMPMVVGGIIYMVPEEKFFSDIEDAINVLETSTASLQTTSTYLSQINFNVKSYGAVGDGVTNDAVAIQAAVTAAIAIGGEVYFPPGIYKVSTGIVVPSTSSLTIRGASWASVLTGTAATLLTVTGGTTITYRVTVKNMMVLVPGAQTGISYNGTWSSGGTTGLCLDNVYVHGTGTSTQILVNYVGMANTCWIRESTITNNDASNDATALLCNGASSSVMGLRVLGSTLIAKRGINLTGTGVAPLDVEGIWIDGCEIAGTTYGVRIGQSLAIGITHCEFTAGGTSILLVGANAHTVIDHNYMDIGINSVPMIDIQSSGSASNLYTKITNNHLYGGNATGITGIKVDTTNAGFYNGTITGNDITTMDTGMDFSTGVLGGEFAINVITNNPLRSLVTGIAMGTSSTKRTGNIITDNPIGTDVTTYYTGQRIGNTILTNTNDADQTWTPAITSPAGAPTTVSCAGHYKQRDEKHWWFQFVITLTTNGPAGSYLICPLPTGFTGAAFAQAMFGFRSDSIGIFGSLSSGASAINIQTVAGAYPGVNGTTITMTGELEMA